MTVLELNLRAKPIIPPKPPGFGPIEEGKKYLLRNGKIIGPMEKKEYAPHKLWSKEGYWWNKNSGLFGDEEHNPMCQEHIIGLAEDEYIILSEDEAFEWWIAGNNLYYINQLIGSWFLFPHKTSFTHPSKIHIEMYKFKWGRKV